MTWGRAKDIVLGLLIVAVFVLAAAVLIGYHRQALDSDEAASCHVQARGLPADRVAVPPRELPQT